MNKLISIMMAATLCIGAYATSPTATTSGSDTDINIDSFRLEQLAMVEPESPSGGDPSKFMLPNIHVESDYTCNGSFTERECDITECWTTDPRYTSQPNWLLQTPCMLEVAPPVGPDQTIQPGQAFASFSVYEMPYDSYDRERKGLFNRRMQLALAPWTSQNPIFMHLTSTDTATVRRAVDQCAECGYEMIILSFGSGLNAEDTSDENIARYKALVDYAHSKGIEMGCYSLLASRWISDSVDVINPKTGKRGGMHFAARHACAATGDTTTSTACAHFSNAPEWTVSNTTVRTPATCAQAPRTHTTRDWATRSGTNSTK